MEIFFLAITSDFPSNLVRYLGSEIATQSAAEQQTQHKGFHRRGADFEQRYVMKNPVNHHIGNEKAKNHPEKQ